jgi:hypothetical protein
MAPDSDSPASDGLYLYAVARSRSRRAHKDAGAPTVTRVRFREIEAIVRPVPYAMPDLDAVRVEEHQRVVDAVMQRATILPVPFGMVFQGRRAVLRFLEDQYIVLDEGLAFLDGHWELRLHIMGATDGDELRSLATELYSDLRRLARAAIPLPVQEGRLLSAAFLVERGNWIRFVEQSDDLDHAHPELVFDVTGPWPPYDFVTVQI